MNESLSENRIVRHELPPDQCAFTVEVIAPASGREGSTERDDGRPVHYLQGIGGCVTIKKGEDWVTSRYGRLIQPLSLPLQL
jgi:hypothetical protein